MRSIISSSAFLNGDGFPTKRAQQSNNIVFHILRLSARTAEDARKEPHSGIDDCRKIVVHI